MKIFCLTFLSILLSFSVNSQLNVNFSATPLTLCVGEQVSFTDLTTGPVVSWVWNFGDGNTSNIQNPTHTYSAPGTYNITLTASDGNTAVAEVKANYITVNPLPTVSFSTPTTNCAVPYSPSFNSVLPNSGSFTYSWDFGNGQTSSNQVPTNANYTTTGTFDVVLTVTNTQTGCINSFSQQISVFEYNTDFTVSANTVCVGESVSFQDQSTGGANSWLWNFGNGASSNSQNPIISYPTSGTYEVTLTSQNTVNGCMDNFSQTIEVLPLPEPSFTGTPTIGCDPLVVDYTNTSSGTGTFEWNFGNGNTFTGQNPPDQTYLNIGSYNVSLTFTDENGCINTVTQNNYIQVDPLIPNFEADVVEGCEDLEVQFTDLSSSPNATDNPITGWEWDFGNGNTFSGENPPVQTYSEGVYSVTLTITTDGGCTEIITLDDYIKVGIPPNVGFTYTPLEDCAKSEFEFTSTTVIPPGYDPEDVTWEWDFGDESGTSTLENPTYDYPVDTGYFDVQLIVSFRGCRDTLTIENAVYIKAPIALFDPEQTVFCNPTLPLSVDFTDNAILGEETDDVEMIWKWGDATTDVLVSPDLFTNSEQGSMSHTYTNYGTYVIEQVVHNYTTGCSDSVTRTIHMSFIEAGFTLSADSVCRNFPVNLANTSSSTHPITNFSYDMNNGTVLSGAGHSYVYNTSGSFDITLNITNNVGCTASQTFTDFVALQEPQAQISPSASAGCVPLNVVFTNNSSTQGNGAPLASFEWTFEDNSTQTTNDVSETTSYNFTSTGSYVTTLVVTDEFGCVSNPHSITTNLTAPTAQFTLEPIVCNLETFNTNNNSLNFSSSEWFVDGEIVSNDINYTSFFEEENPTNASSITHTVTLVVTDQNGCTDTVETDIVVSLPQVDASYNFVGSNVNDEGEFVCPPVFADLTDNSTSFGDVVQWNWTFGDNNGSTLQNPSNTYVFAGTYTATLSVTDEYGCSDSTAFIDYLVIGGPTGNVEWLSVGGLCNPDYEFIPSELVNVTNIVWDLGNGETVNNTSSFVHTYNNPGTYFPTALIQDDNNCAVLYEMDPITTIITEITADFSVNPNIIPVYDPMSISDNSSGGTGGIINWDWTFGNDNFSLNSGGNFTYEWQYPGQHTITLIVTDSLGCTDEISLTVFVTAELYIPNVLTANGDGVNDIFKLKEPVFVSYDIIIFNRWGNIVSELYDQNGVYLWDGKTKSGEFSSEGVYFFKLVGTQYDGIEINEHGFVTLVLE